MDDARTEIAALRQRLAALERLSATKGSQMYNEMPTTFARRKRKQAGAGWRHDPEMERLVKLRDTRPEAYDAMSPTVKMALGYYLSGKDAARAEGLDTAEPKS